MSKYYITLPNGKVCGMGKYVAAWKVLKDASPETLWPGFCHFPECADEILRRMRDGMHDRINRRLPGFGSGRKWNDDWQRAMCQFAHRANTPRLILDWIPRGLEDRFRHRLRGEL